MGFKYLFPTLSFKNCHPLDAGMSKISLSRLSEVLPYSRYLSKSQNRTLFWWKLDRKWPECGPEMAKVWTGSKPEVEMIINSFLWLVWLLISVLVRYEFGEYQHRHNSLQERVCMEHNEQLLKSIFQKWLIHHNRNHQLCLQSWQILAMAMNEELLLDLKWAISMSHKYESAHDHVRFNEISFMSDDPGFDRFDSEFERIC